MGTDIRKNNFSIFNGEKPLSSYRPWQGANRSLGRFNERKNHNPSYFRSGLLSIGLTFDRAYFRSGLLSIGVMAGSLAAHFDYCQLSRSQSSSMTRETACLPYRILSA
jgi:hypothetical protein